MNEKAKRNIFLCCGGAFLFIAALLLIPFVQDFLLHIGESFLGRELRRPEKWIGLFRKYSVFLILISAFLYSCVFFKVQIQHGMQISRNFYLSNTAKIEIVCVFITFTTLAFFYIFRLTESSLAYDEGVEYWVSKSISGIAYGGASFQSNMYERICNTYQPPLYNILMFLWLKISDTEFWLKFFGVVCFFAGDIAFYLTCREFSNRLPSCAFTFLFGISHIFIYYAHEVSEYVCLFCFICWLTLFFYRVVKNFSWKNLCGYFAFAVLSIYSQYGSVFIIFGTGICLILKLMIERNRQKKKGMLFRFTICSIVSIVVFVLPLFLLFIRKQLFRRSSGLISIIDHTPHYKYSNFLFDYIGSFFDVVHYFFYAPSNKILLAVFLCLFVLFLVFVVMKKMSNKSFYLLSLALFISWTVYYIAVRFNYYSLSYTSGFGNRWGFAFCSLIALFFVNMTICAIDCFKLYINKKIVCFSMACSFIFLMGMNMKIALKNHGIKSNVREYYNTINESEELNKLPVLTEVWQITNIMYYANHDEDSKIRENIHQLEWKKKITVEGVKQSFNSIFSETPKKFLFFYISPSEDGEVEIDSFKQLGYVIEKDVRYSEIEKTWWYYDIYDVTKVVVLTRD